MKIYAFNPEHDLAMAHGGENYTPPPLAVQLRHDLEMLPLWLDKLSLEEILYAINTGVLPEGIRIFGDYIRIEGPAEYEPWGWDSFMRRRFLNAGANEEDLPSIEKILEYRDLSHRRTSIALLKELRDKGLLHDAISLPIESSDIEEVLSFARSHHDCFVKAPWSGSGKGVYRGYFPDSLDFRNWCCGVIRKQGSIICEPCYDKTADFALEFYADESGVRFAGYSMFDTDKHSAFTSSVVLPRSGFEAILPDLQYLIDAYTQLLPKYIIDYKGYFGIDMLRCGDIVHPCVELNLRTTMGVVAMRLGDRYLAQGTRGVFNVTYHKAPISVREWVGEQAKRNPLKMSGGKIVSGFLSLVPVLPTARYSCSLLVSDYH